MTAMPSSLLVLGLLLAAPLGDQPAAPLAPAQTSVAGRYEADMRETASVLVLEPDGAFRWELSVGALDMIGEGRWRQADGAILLTSDPPVAAPRFELVRTERSTTPGIMVRLAAETDAERQVADYLDAEAEYSDGTRIRAHLEDGEQHFPGGGARAVRSVRMSLPMFGVQSESFAVGPGGNVLVFRFVPNDLGRADFRDQRVTVAGDRLSLPFMGDELRYIRAGMREQVRARELATSGGLVDVRLGEPVAATMARSTFPFDLGREHGEGSVFGGVGVVEMRLRFGQHSIDLGRVGGADHFGWRVDPGAQYLTIDQVEFSHQDRLLELDEAIARAQAFERWLVAAGFAPSPGPPHLLPESPFVPFTASGSDARISFADWAAATAFLRAPDRRYWSMDLFMLRNGEYYAQAELANLRTMSTDEEGQAYLATSGGREWRLKIMVYRDPSITMERDFPTRGGRGSRP
jgi:hypothetical protein